MWSLAGVYMVGWVMPFLITLGGAVIKGMPFHGWAWGDTLIEYMPFGLGEIYFLCWDWVISPAFRPVGMTIHAILFLYIFYRIFKPRTEDSIWDI